MLKEMTGRLCLSCRKAIKGRTDKKFCDDFCRNNYNNHLKGGDNNLIRNVNNALRKNRRIMALLLEESGAGMIKVRKDELAVRGFTFKYITHTYTNKEGGVYYFCYEYGYLPLANDYYLLVKRKESPGKAGAREKG